MIETGPLEDALGSQLDSEINFIACFQPCANEKESSATFEEPSSCTDCFISSNGLHLMFENLSV